MPVVQSVIKFRKPSDTKEISSVIKAIHVLPDVSLEGEPVGGDYLDKFSVGDEITLSVLSSTGKANRVRTNLLSHIISNVGENMEIISSKVHEDIDDTKLRDLWTGRYEQFLGRITRNKKEPGDVRILNL